MQIGFTSSGRAPSLASFHVPSSVHRSPLSSVRPAFAFLSFIFPFRAPRFNNFPERDSARGRRGVSSSTDAIFWQTNFFACLATRHWCVGASDGSGKLGIAETLERRDGWRDWMGGKEEWMFCFMLDWTWMDASTFLLPPSCTACNTCAAVSASASVTTRQAGKGRFISSSKYCNGLCTYAKQIEERKKRVSLRRRGASFSLDGRKEGRRGEKRSRDKRKKVIKTSGHLLKLEKG